MVNAWAWEGLDTEQVRGWGQNDLLLVHELPHQAVHQLQAPVNIGRRPEDSLQQLLNVSRQHMRLVGMVNRARTRRVGLLLEVGGETVSDERFVKSEIHAASLPGTRL
ncbi:hypothetical protein GCM10027600_00090 [Nocardioides ginsengisegetis]